MGGKVPAKGGSKRGGGGLGGQAPPPPTHTHTSTSLRGQWPYSV